MTQSTPTDPASLLLRQFLAWIDARPRSYAETMEAWRTSCPRLPVWEDAVDGGLLRVVPGEDGTQGAARVVLTEAGRAAAA